MSSGITRTALLSPLYWGLMSWAAWKGAIQLFTNPFYWEKTEHGLDGGGLVSTHTPVAGSGPVTDPARRLDRPGPFQPGATLPASSRPSTSARTTSRAARGRASLSSSSSTGGYIWFGYWLVVKMHVVGFETLDRLNRALMIWHNNPAKLSALGFDYPPLATLLISPLAIFPASPPRWPSSPWPRPSSPASSWSRSTR